MNLRPSFGEIRFWVEWNLFLLQAAGKYRFPKNRILRALSLNAITCAEIIGRWLRGGSEAQLLRYLGVAVAQSIIFDFKAKLRRLKGAQGVAAHSLNTTSERARYCIEQLRETRDEYASFPDDELELRAFVAEFNDLIEDFRELID